MKVSENEAFQGILDEMMFPVDILRWFIVCSVHTEHNGELKYSPCLNYACIIYGDGVYPDLVKIIKFLTKIMTQNLPTRSDSLRGRN